MAIVEEDSGTPLASTDANYMTETECKAYNDANGREWTSFSYTDRPSGCIVDNGAWTYWNTHSNSNNCATNYKCIQKSGNTWAAGKPNVEVQLATYDISKLNDLQNLDRTVNDLTVDTLHGLSDIFVNPLAKAGSATGTQTIVSCDFPGQVVDVACSDPTKTTAATCVGACSDPSQTTQGTCITAGLTAHEITDQADGAFSVYTADVDGDGDMDVLSASYLDNKIIWYENDGAQVFTVHEITDQADSAFSVYAADVDGDGDMDVLSASCCDNTVGWYENNGASDPTFTAHTITTSADGARSVYAVDVDGDGDMDVLSASSGDNKIAWYKNDGTWTARTWAGPATYVCTSPTTWTPIAGESSIALKGANPDTIVQNSGSYTDVGGVRYDANGAKVDGGITVSGQVVDATAACDTEFTLLFDCAGAAQVSRKVKVECP